MNNKFAPLLFLVTCLSCHGWIVSDLCADERTPTVELELAKSVVVRNKDYTLSDVTVPESSPGWREQKIGAVVLGRSPRPGQIAHITRAQLSARLESLFPGIQQAIHWKGASTVKVRTAGINLAGERLVEVAKDYLVQVLNEQFERYSVSPADISRDIIVPQGKLAFVASLGGKQRAGKRTCVWVDVTVAGRHYQTVPVWFEVESYQNVWVLSVDKAKNEYLDASVLKQEQYDIAQLAENPLEQDLVMDGLRMTRAVTAGQVLTRSMVETIPVVEKGELVTVHATSGNVSVSTRAIALSDGDLSQRIAVQNTKHGESYAVVVVGRGEVAVNEN